MLKNKKEKKPKSKKRNRKIIKLVLSLVIIAALIVCGIIFIPDLINKDTDSKSTLQKRTATVIKGDVVKTIGSSSPLESSESVVYKPGQTGDILEILVEDGDLVSEGDIILIIDTTRTDETIETLESQIESKFEQINDKEDLIEDKNNAIEDRQEDIQGKRDDISELEADIAVLEEDIYDNEDSRADLNVYAPISGTIFDIEVNTGDNVTTNTVFATVTNTVSYEVELTFSSKILNEEIQSVYVYYKNNKLDTEIVSIADYTYKDRFGNEMVDVLLSFSTDISLPDRDVVEGFVHLEFLSYHSTSDVVPYFADTESITTEVSGEILELYLIEKQSVKQGDLVAVIAADSIEEKTNSINNQIEVVEEQITNINDAIETYYENIDTYYEDIIDFNEDITDLKDEITTIEEEIEEAKSEYEAANIIADFNGVVSELAVEVGDSVSANTRLFSLVRLESPSMVVSIDELDIAQVEIGQEAEVVIDALSDTEKTPVNAVVTKIAIEGNYQGGVTTYDVTLMLLDPVEGLKLSMNATATIYINKSEDTLYIPIEAVTIQSGKSFVYVQDISAAGTPIDNKNSTKNDDTAENNQTSAGKAAAGAQRPGGQKSGNVDLENMTDEQIAAMKERLAANGMTLDDIAAQKEAATESDSESISDIADYYTGAHLVEVTTGIYNELYIEILSGINAGDIVILPPLYTSDTSESKDTVNSALKIPGIGSGLTGTGGAGTKRPAGGTGGN